MIEFDTVGLENYVTSQELETLGVWFNFGGGRRIKMRRAGGANKAFSRAFTAATKPFRRQMDRGTLPPETSDKLMREVYAKAVIVDWDGIHSKGGDIVPCEPQNVIAFFTAFPDLFNDVVSLAGDMSSFAQSHIEDALAADDAEVSVD